MGFLKRLYKHYIDNNQNSHCKFFDEFGLFVQGVLGLLCFSVLIFKRFKEKPMRPWKIWGYDVSKQVFGQLTQHMFNLLVAMKIGQNSSLECEWYLINIVSDCCLGVFINYIYLNIITYSLKDCGEYSLTSGDYGDNGNCNKYLYQLVLWLVIVTISKMTCIGIILIFGVFLQNIAQTILSPLGNYVHFKLVLVVIIVPGICNSIQFWITDNILKKEEPYLSENKNEVKEEKHKYIEGKIDHEDENRKIKDDIMI